MLPDTVYKLVVGFIVGMTILIFVLIPSKKDVALEMNDVCKPYGVQQIYARHIVVCKNGEVR